MHMPSVTTHASNALRFQHESLGHVESYFLKANHPVERQALWLKATILRKANGDTVAEAWCALFDGDAGSTLALKKTVPWENAFFAAQPGAVDIDGCQFTFGPTGGTSSGAIAGGSEGQRRAAWRLSWSLAESPLAAPLCLYPSQRLIDGRFPRSKLLTPAPVLRFSGSIECNGAAINVDNWLGMQGHNWGKEHAYRYAWGQCIFADDARQPVCMVEAASGQLKIGPVLTPPMSMMVVRRGAKEYRFDRFYALWAAQSTVQDTTWTLKAKGAAGEALLQLQARPEEMVCLGYKNPDDALSYCLNSKLSRASLHVSPVNEQGFACHSAHGAALELLQRQPDPRFLEVV